MKDVPIIPHENLTEYYLCCFSDRESVAQSRQVIYQGCTEVNDVIRIGLSLKPTPLQTHCSPSIYLPHQHQIQQSQDQP
jgi:hypothetical protein